MTLRLKLATPPAITQGIKGTVRMGLITIPFPILTGDVVTITVDKTFTVPGDSRELGMILTDVGFVP